MRKILFATGNPKKLEEAKRIFSISGYVVISPSISDEIPEPEETGMTFEENALITAKYYHEVYKIPCFAEDSGLEVEALAGKPGIYSARFAAMNHSVKNNIDFLLEQMINTQNRKAKFTAVICLILNENDIHYFNGEVKGSIAETPSGKSGFGYDPVFIPDGYDESFAVLGNEVKDRISHRKNAIELLHNYLLSVSDS
jgi:XTP/dITP diphosphohydrolase